uniref:Uncharacterized protein MANES_14G015800 n=1 Tax=Rhizophora mucronata TaxID=61149 RepID=A0A2P2JKT6_RHIMU
MQSVSIGTNSRQDHFGPESVSRYNSQQIWLQFADHTHAYSQTITFVLQDYRQSIQGVLQSND